jgi:hypothetical protein
LLSREIAAANGSVRRTAAGSGAKLEAEIALNLVETGDAAGEGRLTSFAICIGSVGGRAGSAIS